MNEGNRNSRILLWIVIVLLPLAIALMILLRGFVREMVVIPLSYLAWVGGYLIRSTPQILYWIVFIFIGLILAIQSLAAVAKNEPRPVDSRVRYPRRERVSFWLTQLYYSRQGYLRTRFSEFFSRLAIDVLAFREQASTSEIDRRLKDAELDVPPELLAYIKSRRIQSPAREGGWLVQFFMSLFGRRNEQGAAPQPPDPQRQLETAIRYLEDQLEVKNDR